MKNQIVSTATLLITLNLAGGAFDGSGKKITPRPRKGENLCDPPPQEFFRR